MHKNKILIVSNVPFWGGGENFVAETLNQLSTYYELHYLVANDQLFDLLPEGSRSIFSGKGLLAQYQELKSAIKNYAPDLILFNGGSLFYFLPLIKGKRVLYRHSTDRYSPPKWRWLYKIIMNTIYHFADLTIHVSEYSRREQLLNKQKSICIHNGIKVGEQFKKDIKKPLKVVYCSRLEESKGIRQIIEAFKQIEKSQAELYVLGTGSLEEWIRENASENVRVMGFRKDVDAFYKDSDVMILMSEYENCPISVLEAMSYSLPIITSGAGGIAEQVKNGYNGLVIARTPKAIRDAVIQLSSNPAKCIEMGNNAFTACRSEFDINIKVEEIHQALDRVLHE